MAMMPSLAIGSNRNKKLRSTNERGSGDDQQKLTPDGGNRWGQSWLDTGAGGVCIQLYKFQIGRTRLRFKLLGSSIQTLHANLKTRSAMLSDRGQRLFGDFQKPLKKRIV